MNKEVYENTIRIQFEMINELTEKIDKAYNKIENMFDRGEEETLIDDLLELQKILKGE